MPSVDDEQARAGPGRRAVRLVAVSDVVAHPGPQHEAPAVLQLRLELALEDEQDMALLGPVCRPVARRVLDHSYPHVADLARPPGRVTGLAGLARRRDRAPVRRVERNRLDLHRQTRGSGLNFDVGAPLGT